VDHFALQKKISSLNSDFIFSLILAIAILITVASSKEACVLGWDAKKFMYTISGLYFGESFLILIQVNYVKSHYRENPCIMFLRYVMLCTLTGFYISGNVGYYNNPFKADCSRLLS
jgi:hypothetical protein